MTKRQTEAYERGEHVMSSREGAVMRRIQSETGMTKEEVRGHKKYRVMLSEAAKPGRMAALRLRQRIQAEAKSNWEFGSTKAMFMQKASQVLNGDKEAVSRLYKRYAGGLVDNKRPAAFHYRKFNTSQFQTDIMKAIDKTDGMFVFSPDRNEVGFMYESSLTMFSLVYQVK